jgi:hypothetical protein
MFIERQAHSTEDWTVDSVEHKYSASRGRLPAPQAGSCSVINVSIIALTFILDQVGHNQAKTPFQE